MSVCYLDNADWFPGQVEAGVEQEGEDEGERSVPAQRKHKRAAMRADRWQDETLNSWKQLTYFTNITPRLKYSN